VPEQGDLGQIVNRIILRKIGEIFRLWIALARQVNMAFAFSEAPPDQT